MTQMKINTVFYHFSHKIIMQHETFLIRFMGGSFVNYVAPEHSISETTGNKMEAYFKE